jgi:membrane associated rhomboid family serine protease
MRLEAKPALGINPEPTPGNAYLTLLTSMFMHGGLAHLFGNMLFLRSSATTSNTA